MVLAQGRGIGARAPSDLSAPPMLPMTAMLMAMMRRLSRKGRVTAYGLGDREYTEALERLGRALKRRGCEWWRKNEWGPAGRRHGDRMERRVQGSGGLLRQGIRSREATPR